MWEILTDKTISWSDKLGLIWEQLKQMWTDFSSNPEVQAAWTEIWVTIKDWCMEQLGKVWVWIQEEWAKIFPSVSAFAMKAFTDVAIYLIANAPGWILGIFQKIPGILWNAFQTFWNSNSAAKGTVIGGVVGTGIGGVVGPGGALIGGAIGSGVGGWVGGEFDKSNTKQQKVAVTISVNQKGTVNNVDILENESLTGGYKLQGSYS